MRGLQPGEKRRTRIEPINAYGERTDELIFSLPLQSVPSGMEVSPDAVVPLSNGMRARVIEVTDTEVRLDANHELAGKALTFDMELVQFVELELQPVASGLRRAVFSMGCFWGMFLSFISSVPLFLCLGFY